MYFDSVKDQLEKYGHKIVEETQRVCKIDVITDLVQDDSITIEKGSEILDMPVEELEQLRYSKMEQICNKRLEESNADITKEYFEKIANIRIKDAEDIDYLKDFIVKNRKNILNALLEEFKEGWFADNLTCSNRLESLIDNVMKGYIKCSIGVCVELINENKISIKDGAETLNVSDFYLEMLVKSWDEIKLSLQ